MTQVHSLAPYTEQGMVFSGGDDRSIRAWRFNAQTSHFDLVGTMEGHSAAVLEMQIIGNLLFSADISGVIKVNIVMKEAWVSNSLIAFHSGLGLKYCTMYIYLPCSSKCGDGHTAVGKPST